MGIFGLIGLFVVVKFAIRNRRMFMDKDAFFKAVAELRRSILEKWWLSANQNLDTLVSTIVKGEEKMSEELSLREDVTRIIKRIKEAKENEALREKAEELIDTLKKEL